MKYTTYIIQINRSIKNHYLLTIKNYKKKGKK